MQKIMFDNRFGLTAAVREGCKNMTRRPARKKYIKDADGNLSWNGEYLPPRYKVGEVVAVAQSYREIEKEIEREGLPLTLKDSILKSPGYRNKMFVKAEFMPLQIRITAVRGERLQDISDEDCLREGVRKLESDGCPTMFSFDGWRFKNKVNRCTDSPKEAFEALFKKLSGKKAWDDNPYVDVYEFEKVK